MENTDELATLRPRLAELAKTMETAADRAVAFRANYDALRAQRDELIAALKDARAEIIDLLEGQIGREVKAADMSPRLVKIENILAKARGQKGE